MPTDSTATAPLPLPMPEDLREKGWISVRSAGKFRAKNNTQGLFSAAFDKPEEAIHAARELDAGKSQIIQGDGSVRFEFLPPMAPDEDETTPTILPPAQTADEEGIE